MTAEQQHRARQALAFLAQTLRPDWDPPGITAAIEALHRDRQPLGVIAKATIAAALTASTKTPGGIAARIRDGFDGSNVHPATHVPSKVGTCGDCGAFVVPGEDHAKHCAPRGDHTAGAAAARAALAAAAEETT